MKIKLTTLITIFFLYSTSTYSSYKQEWTLQLQRSDQQRYPCKRIYTHMNQDCNTKVISGEYLNHNPATVLNYPQNFNLERACYSSDSNQSTDQELQNALSQTNDSKELIRAQAVAAGAIPTDHNHTVTPSKTIPAIQRRIESLQSYPAQNLQGKIGQHQQYIQLLKQQMSQTQQTIVNIRKQAHRNMTPAEIDLLNKQMIPYQQYINKLAEQIKNYEAKIDYCEEKDITQAWQKKWNPALDQKESGARRQRD